MPAASACLAMLAARLISSYELLVQDPISAALSSVGHPFFFSAGPKADRGLARSGVKGPLMWGSSSDRLISTSWS